jgi:hypothetical protein
MSFLQNIENMGSKYLGGQQGVSGQQTNTVIQEPGIQQATTTQGGFDTILNQGKQFIQGTTTQQPIQQTTTTTQGGGMFTTINDTIDNFQETTFHHKKGQQGGAMGMVGSYLQGGEQEGIQSRFANDYVDSMQQQYLHQQAPQQGVGGLVSSVFGGSQQPTTVQTTQTTTTQQSGVGGIIQGAQKFFN